MMPMLRDFAKENLREGFVTDNVDDARLLVTMMMMGLFAEMKIHCCFLQLDLNLVLPELVK